MALTTLIGAAGLLISATQIVRAEEPPMPGYTMGGLLDPRSRFGQGWFPEPLLAPEMDRESELRFDYFHSQKKSDRRTDSIKAEIEYSVGLVTFEIEGFYTRESERELNDTTGLIDHNVAEGIENIELSVRHPLFQFVNKGESIDYTLSGALEVAVPSGSRISEDTEIVPQLFHLLRIGDHLSVQGSVGYSFRIGPDEGGESALEYTGVVGYTFNHDELPIPGTTRVTPLFELIGERGLSKEAAGQTELFGVAGVRANLRSMGDVQPRVGIGYVFPLGSNAREEMNWGIVTSFAFEF